MHLAIQLVSDLGAGGPETREVASIDRPDDRLAIDDLGLTIAETKAMLAALQAAITDAQVLAHVRRERPCPCCGRARRLKDRRNITVRTCFGKLALASPRFARCSCEAVPGIAAPLVAALPERVTPDLLALEARWEALAKSTTVRSNRTGHGRVMPPGFLCSRGSLVVRCDQPAAILPATIGP